MPSVSTGKGSQVSLTANTTTQIDNRLAATENARVIGAGGYLDESYFDGSTTNIDSSDRSLTQIDSSDRSVTSIDNSDNSLTQIDSSDRRSFVDNSTTYSLDGQTVQGVIDATERIAEYNANQTLALNAQNAALASQVVDVANDFAARESALAFGLAGSAVDLTRNSFDAALAATIDLGERQQKFTSDFFREFNESQTDSAERITTDVLDAGKKLGIAVAVVFALRALAS